MSLQGHIKAILFLFVCCWSTMSVRAQQGCNLVISGSVIDEHDRTPLSFAEVFLPQLLRGAVTGEDGLYRIEGLCPGTYTVRVAHLGCSPVEKRVVLDRNVALNFKLEHHAEELRELEVVAARPDENVGLARSELTRSEMEKRGGSIAEVIAGIPGVNMLSSGPTIAKPMINGMYGNRILVLNQGIRQEDQQWGSEHAPNLDPFSTDRVTVVKGVASVQYGADAIGGVVITEPVELPREGGVSGELALQGLYNARGGGAGGLLQGGVSSWKGFGWRVQGSLRRTGDASAPDYVLSNTGMREAGLSAAMGLQRHRAGATVYYSWFGRELGILRASHIGNLTDLSNAIANGTPWYVAPFTYAINAPRQQVQHHLLKAEGYLRLSDRDRLVATYGYQANDRQEYDIRRGGRSAIPALDMFLTTHTGELVLKHWLGEKLHGKVGVGGMVQENSNIPGTGVRPLIPDHTRNTLGIFILEHLPLGERLELEAGFRLEGTGMAISRFNSNDQPVSPTHDYVNHAFSTGANWSVGDSLLLRANVGSAFRPPQVSELYSEGLHHGAAAIEEGDPDLGSERALRAALEFDGRWLKGKLRSNITLHATRFNGYIYLRPDGYRLTIRGAFPVFSYVATDAALHGLDAELEYAFGAGFSVRSRFSLVRGRDLEKEEWLFQMPADRVENAVLYRRHAWGAMRGVELAITSTIVARQERIPVGLDFTVPPDGYHLLGCSASLSTPIGHNELRFGLQGFNLLDQAFRDYLDRFRYYADARGMDLMVWLRFSFGNAHHGAEKS